MTGSESVKCTVCEQPEQLGILHGPGGTMRHPFTKPDQPDWVPPKEKPKPTPMPARTQQQMVILPQPDLALRALLVAAGVITQEQLKEAEDALRFPNSPSTVPPQ
jgi:hypothetical protein